jgi:ferredoxin
MATVITEECINCGACEPECPNTAIYQGGVEYDWLGKKNPALSAEIFYIVPEKCTECVGFFDHEACAAVCPVDCCVPDPARPESEGALLERAKELHPDKEFGADFPSRFRQGASAAAASPAEAQAVGAGAPPAAPSAPAAAAVEELPSADPSLFEVPIVCRTCQGEYRVEFRFLTPGLVLRCPHCGVNFTATRRLYMAVQERLARFSDMMSSEVDRHLRALQTEQELYEENVVDIQESAEREVRRLIDEHTEPPKRTIFG